MTSCPVQRHLAGLPAGGQGSTQAHASRRLRLVAAMIAIMTAWACLNPAHFGLATDTGSAGRLQPPAVLPLTGPAAGMTIDNNTSLSASAASAGSTGTRTQDGVRPPAVKADDRSSHPHANDHAAAKTVPHDQRLREGYIWAKALEPASHLIQFGSSSSIEAALKLRQRYPVLGQARLVAFRRTGENITRFALVSGSYRSRAQAASALDQLGRKAPPTSWLRRSAHLQTHLVPAVQQESAS